jgi:exo-beta-1,3-glucanase (GH17 family)
MLYFVKEMTYFNIQTFLTPGEHIITYFSKFSSGSFRYCAGSLTASAWLTRYQPYRRAYGTLHRLKSHRPVKSALCNRRVMHGVTYMCSVREYAVQFSTEDFHYGNLYKEEIVRKIVVGNLEYSSLLFQFLRNKACRRTGGHFQQYCNMR